MIKIEDSGAFITPDGGYYPCYSGGHGFSATQILADIGEEAARGSIIIWPDGSWVQEGCTGSLTPEQREQIGYLAEFQECGIQIASANILATLVNGPADRLVRRAIASADGQQAIDRKIAALAKQFGLDGDTTSQINASLC